MLANKGIRDDLVIVGAIASSDLENEILDFVVGEASLPLQRGKHVGTGRRHRFRVTQRWAGLGWAGLGWLSVCV